jgi:general secretion pathway protein G
MRTHSAVGLRRLRGGFSLVEVVVIVIFLGVLAAIIVPQFTSADVNPRDKAVVGELHMIRAAIELYRAQHGDTLPDLSNGWNPLLQQSDAEGGKTGTPLFGPYLPGAPVNAVTGGNSISGSPESAVDWYWDASTGNVTAMDARRQIYVESP